MTHGPTYGRNRVPHGRSLRVLARFMDWVGHWGGSSMSEEEMGGHEVREVRGADHETSLL